VLSAFTLTGCAVGESVAELDETVYWVSKARQKGRAVHKMVGLQQQLVSTPDIDRILATSDLSSVYSYGVKLSGHSFYILGLRDIDVTLAYDATAGTWAQWSSLTAQTPKSCTLTQAGGVVTAACTAHGYADGAAVTISGATPSAYNGLKQIRATSADAFTFGVASGTASPATGTIEATGYDEGYFRYSHYVAAAGRDLVLHETTGALVEITPDAYTDDGAPIALKISDRKTRPRQRGLQEHWTGASDWREAWAARRCCDGRTMTTRRTRRAGRSICRRARRAYGAAARSGAEALNCCTLLIFLYSSNHWKLTKR
jgi:hypothetical protein